MGTRKNAEKKSMGKIAGQAEPRSVSPWSIQPCQEDHGESTVVVDLHGYVICRVPSAAWNEKATDVESQRDRANLNFMITARKGHFDLSFEIDSIAADLAAGDMDSAKAAEILATISMNMRAARQTSAALAAQDGLTANDAVEEARGWMNEHDGQFSDEDRAVAHALLGLIAQKTERRHSSSGSAAIDGSPQGHDLDDEQEEQRGVAR